MSAFSAAKYLVHNTGSHARERGSFGALKLQDWTQTDEVARVENAGLDNGGRGCKSEL